METGQVRRIAILLASVRDGRKSDRVGRFFQEILKNEPGCETEIIDLREYDFPVFHERLRYIEKPPEKMVEFSSRIKAASGVIIVTPEYNGGYPAALKNVTDLLYDEWKRKPIAITTVSSGAFGGSQVITSLLFTLWKIGAWVVPAMFPVPKVEESFSDTGVPSDPALKKRASVFINELIFAIDAQRALGAK